MKSSEVRSRIVSIDYRTSAPVLQKNPSGPVFEKLESCGMSPNYEEVCAGEFAGTGTRIFRTARNNLF